VLIRKIEIFLRQTGMPAARFGHLAAGDRSLVRDLRNGRTPRAKLQSRVEHYMNNALSGEPIDAE
jgi:hypothetical protein